MRELAGEYIEILNSLYKDNISLLKPEWRKRAEESGEPSTGFCYIASEALYYLLGGKEVGLVPQVATAMEGGVKLTHWWLKGIDGEILDATARQFLAFGRQPPYHLGRGCGFMTEWPSRRAWVLIHAVKGKMNVGKIA